TVGDVRNQQTTGAARDVQRRLPTFNEVPEVRNFWPVLVELSPPPRYQAVMPCLRIVLHQGDHVRFRKTGRGPAGLVPAIDLWTGLKGRITGPLRRYTNRVLGVPCPRRSKGTTGPSCQ